MSDKKSAIVRLFNKGQRIIQASIGNIKPNSVSEVPEAEAKKLLKLFDGEVISLSEGEDPSKAQDQSAGKIKALEAEVAFLKAKVEELEKALEASCEDKKEDKEAEEAKKKAAVAKKAAEDKKKAEKK